MRKTILLGALVACCATMVLAQDAKPTGDKPAKTPARKVAPNPAMQVVEDVAGLPRVLLIGDSISIGSPLTDLWTHV